MQMRESRLCNYGTIESFERINHPDGQKIDPLTYQEIQTAVIDSVTYLEKYGYEETIQSLKDLLQGNTEDLDTIIHQSLTDIEQSPESLAYQHLLEVLTQHKQELLNQNGPDAYTALHEHHLQQPKLAQALKNTGKILRKGKKIDMATIVSPDGVIALNTDSLLNKQGNIDFSDITLTLSDGTTILLEHSKIVRKDDDICLVQSPHFTRTIERNFAPIAKTIVPTDTLYLAQIGTGDNNMVQISLDDNSQKYHDSVDRTNDYATEASLKAIKGGVIFNQNGELVTILDPRAIANNGSLDNGLAQDTYHLRKNLTDNGLRIKNV